MSVIFQASIARLFLGAHSRVTVVSLCVCVCSNASCYLIHLWVYARHLDNILLMDFAEKFVSLGDMVLFAYHGWIWHFNRKNHLDKLTSKCAKQWHHKWHSLQKAAVFSLTLLSTLMITQCMHMRLLGIQSCMWRPLNSNCAKVSQQNCSIRTYLEVNEQANSLQLSN